MVASVEQQAAEAAALAGIAGQARLMDPRTNPAVRGHADQLLTDQLTRKLDAENARLRRRIRVEHGRAADAEATLEAIQLARQASSPARSVLALHTSKRAYMRLSLGASLVLAAGSAMGVEAAAEALNAPWGSGYIAEVGLTGLSTAALSYLAHLTEHRGKLARRTWQFRSLWALIVVPPLVSVACNLGMLNPVGAFCAIGAVAFALLGCVVADRSAAAMQDRAAEVSGQDEDELRSVALGDDLFTAVPDKGDEPEPEVQPTRAERDAEALEEAFAAGRQDEFLDEPEAAPDVVEAPGETSVGERAELESLEAQRGLVELEAWLSREGPEEPGDGGVRPVPSPAGPDGGPRGAAADPGGHIEGEGGHIAPPGGHIESDLPDDDETPRRVLPAAQARRAIGATTHQRIAEYVAAHPAATKGEIAKALGVTTKTVQRFRSALRATNQAGTERKAS